MTITKAEQAQDEAPKKYTLGIDFDGVIHSYTTGWQGRDVIADGPMPGAIEWINQAIDDERFRVAVLSSRSETAKGRIAMHQKIAEWFAQENIEPHRANRIWFPAFKPPLWLYIDDRSHQFISWEDPMLDLDRVAAFKPHTSTIMLTADEKKLIKQLMNQAGRPGADIDVDRMNSIRRKLDLMP